MVQRVVSLRARSESDARGPSAVAAYRRGLGFVDRYLERLDDLESALAAEVERLSADWQGPRSSAAAEELSAERERLAREAARLDEDRRGVEALRRRAADAEADLAEEQRRAAERARRLDRREEDVAELESRTREQRRRLAERFAADRLAERAAHARRAHDGPAAEAALAALERRVAEAAAEADSWRRRAAAIEADHEALQTLLNEATDSGQGRLDDARQLTELRAELSRARAERDILQARLDELAAGDGAGASDPDVVQELADLRRRHEMLLEDVRDLRRRNGELEQQAASGRSGSPAAEGSLSWEEQKRRLLARLESEYDDHKPADRADRLTIDGTIRMTDDVVRRKDEQIDALERELAALRAKEASGGPSAEERARLCDADEIVRQERERLREMQRQWEEKQRQSEIELAQERARLARERSDLTEKATTLRLELDKQAAAGAAGPLEGPGGQPRRRWLDRLGLRNQPGE